MNIHEHQAKEVLKKYGANVPNGYFALNVKDLVEKEISVEKIVSKGFDRKIVEKTARLLAKSEYKRFQAAPGPKVTSKAFGRDRRFPLTSGFNNWS